MNDHAARRHPLDLLIAPRSVAIVGASERNHYSNLAMRALQGVGFDGPIWLVNQRGAPAYGMDSVTRLADLAEPVDAAYLCVPIGGLLETAQEAIDAGIRNLVIVTSGFAELGEEGQAREAALKELCARGGARVLGPNCLGFRNNLARVALGSIPFVEQPTTPTIALVSASGSVAASVVKFGIQQGVGFTHVIATGNEMNVTTADLIDYLVGIEEVKAIALFLESVRDPATFVAAVERARAHGKPIVTVKIGAAENTAAVAQAHTGAAVGDDAVFNAVCERHAIVRVPTIEALVITAATLAATGPLARPGVALVSISGGMSEIASDYAGDGVSLPAFADTTCRELATVLSDLGQMHNPLDMTGAAVRDQSMWFTVPAIIRRDPAIGLTLLNWDLPTLAEPSMPETLEQIGRSLRDSDQPMLFIDNTLRPVNEYGRAYLARHQQSFALPGIGAGIDAVAKLVWWSQRVGRDPLPPPVAIAPASGARPFDEQQTLAHLAACGVPVIPTQTVRSAADAVAAARAIGGPVVLKILSPDVAHKSEVGGVALNLSGDDAVLAAYSTMMTDIAARAPQARIDGVLVAPMRRDGIELLVGIARDPQWGLVAALGLGGFWVEALADTALCLLPAGRDEIVAAFRSLRGVRMLEGYRGTLPVDIDAVADVVIRIGEAAQALGEELVTLEVNPLLVHGSRVEALDGLAVWATG